MTRPRHRRPRAAHLAAVIALTVVAAACGADDDQADTITEPGVALAERQDRAAPAVDDADDETPVDALDDEPPADDLDEPTGARSGPRVSEPVFSASLTTVNFDEDVVPLRIDVLALARDGDVVRLELAVTNESEDAEWKPFGTFAARGVADYTLSGVSLVDLTNNLRHLVLVDASGDCVCTNLGGRAIAPGATLTMNASFPAPDAAVDAVDVQLGSLGSIGPVPISGR